MIRRSLVPLALFLLVQLLLPAVVLADDCSDWSLGEVATCPGWALDKVMGFLVGAAVAAGWYLSKMGEEKKEVWGADTPGLTGGPRQDYAYGATEKPVRYSDSTGQPVHRGGGGR